MQHFIIRWRRPRKAALLPELNTYPETPPGFLSGFYPGSKRVEGFRVSFDIKLQLLPELNEYPVTNIYPSWLTKPVKRLKTQFNLLKTPELNEYPIPTALNQYPGWFVRPVKKVSAKFQLQFLPELNEYRQVGSPYPSWLEKQSIKTDFKRDHLIVPELGFYPQIVVSAALLPAFIVQPTFKIVFDIKRIEVKPLIIIVAAPPTPPLWTDLPDAVTVWADNADALTSWSDEVDETTIWTDIP